jgi:glycosyltransferase involved in cell wall biosynthesis
VNRANVFVDIICTVRNEINNITHLVEDLKNQSATPQKIIIVDGNSDDGTYEQLISLTNDDIKFKIIRDLSCQEESSSAGSIARGRNIAIASSKSEFLLMVDAGCRYHKDWVQSYLNQIRRGGELFSGGSMLGAECSSVDLSVAPILGFDLPSNYFTAKPTGTCRSLCVSRRIYNKIGGFDELSKTGEDTDFILRLIKHTQIIGVKGGAALYIPNYKILEACQRLVQYAKGDGSYFQSKKRFLRMIFRIFCQIISIIMYANGLVVIPAIYIFAELLFAYRLEFFKLLKLSKVATFYRFLFSLITPYLYFNGYLIGLKSRYKN